MHVYRCVYVCTQNNRPWIRMLYSPTCRRNCVVLHSFHVLSTHGRCVWLWLIDFVSIDCFHGTMAYKILADYSKQLFVPYKGTERKNVNGCVGVVLAVNGEAVESRNMSNDCALNRSQKRCFITFYLIFFYS